MSEGNIGFETQLHHFQNFSKTFKTMDDLVIEVNDDGISAAGTVDRAFFVRKWSDFRVSEGIPTDKLLGSGSIAIGQLDTFLSLTNECGDSGDDLSILVEPDNDSMLNVSGPNASFVMPLIQNPTSQAGVKQITTNLSDAIADNWGSFGDVSFDFKLAFDAAEFRSLQQVGKSIQNGALFCLVISHEALGIIVKRDLIKIEKSISHKKPIALDEPIVIWFGQWLMDALKAMPGNGTIHVLGGENTPLILRHEAPDEGAYGTIAVVAPRQNESGADE